MGHFLLLVSLSAFASLVRLRPRIADCRASAACWIAFLAAHLVAAKSFRAAQSSLHNCSNFARAASISLTFSANCRRRRSKEDLSFAPEPWASWPAVARSFTRACASWDVLVALFAVFSSSILLALSSWTENKNGIDYYDFSKNNFQLEINMNETICILCIKCSKLDTFKKNFHFRSVFMKTDVKFNNENCIWKSIIISD